MQNKRFIGIIVFLIVLIIIMIVFGMGKKNPSPSTPVPGEVPSEESPSEKPPVDASKERVPSRYACVGEYCDGSMSGETNFTVIKIPLITDGGSVGCGAKIFFAPHTVTPKTTAVLDATYKLLFDIKHTPEIPSDGFRNTVAAYPRLFYEKTTLTNGTAKVYLTGSMYGPGHCAEPEIREQIPAAALQFDTVKRVEIYLNNKIFDWCAMDVSDGEGPCPETPQLWVAEKK